MSLTLLYRAFGFRNYTCLRITTQDGVITLHLEQYPKHDRCSNCPLSPGTPAAQEAITQPSKPFAK